MIIVFLLLISCQKVSIENKQKLEIVAGLSIIDIKADAQGLCVEIEVFLKNISDKGLIVPNNILPHLQILVTSEEGKEISPSLSAHIDVERIPILLLEPGDTYSSTICLNKYYPIERGTERRHRRFPVEYELPKGKYFARVFFKYPESYISQTMNLQYNCLDNTEKRLYQELESFVGDVEVVNDLPVMFEI